MAGKTAQVRNPQSAFAKASADKSAIRNPQSVTVGVLAVQGAVEKHVQMLERCGVRVIPVRFPAELDEVQGLVIPGGESTTVGKLMARYGLDAKIIERAKEGMPIFGTCTGMILLAKKIVDSDQHRLGLMDATVLRNAFGRQIDSFESDLDIECIGPPAFRAVFIRAPYAVEANSSTRVLARCEDKIVLLRQEGILACAFHPELTEDRRVHEYFIRMVTESLAKQGSRG